MVRWQLVVAQGCHQGMVIPINAARFRIGRDSSCQLRPSSPLVEEEHCELCLRSEHLYVGNRSITAVTKVNDREIQSECELHGGDRLNVGPLSFTVREVLVPRPLTVPKILPAEEAIAEMLLSMEDVAPPQREAKSAETIIDQAAVAGHDTIIEQIPTKGGAQPKAAAAADTSGAASEILRHYLRRPR